MQRGRARPFASISCLAASLMCGAAAWMSRKGAVQCTAGGQARVGQQTSVGTRRRLIVHW